MSAEAEWEFFFPNSAAAAAGTEGPFYELAGGVLFPKAIEILATCRGRPRVLLRLAMDFDAGYPVCASLSFERAPGVPDIDAASVRGVNVKKLIDNAIVWQAANARAIVDVNEGGVVRQDGKFYVFGEHDTHDTAGNARALRQHRSVTDSLCEVAEVYEADTTGAPTDAVKLYFSVSKRTATRWVSLARERELLPEYVRPKKEK